jgi:hypothetical protein
MHKDVLMKEINRLCSSGVLIWQQSSRWALPTFIIPKRMGQFVLFPNKHIIRKPYPIPKITTKLQDFTYVTALDLNMGY